MGKRRWEQMHAEAWPNRTLQLFTEEHDTYEGAQCLAWENTCPTFACAVPKPCLPCPSVLDPAQQEQTWAPTLQRTACSPGYFNISEPTAAMSALHTFPYHCDLESWALGGNHDAVELSSFWWKCFKKQQYPPDNIPHRSPFSSPRLTRRKNHDSIT